MKCPNCGFNSFDYLETCKKCNSDLTGHKAKFSLRSLLFPGRQAAPQAAEPPVEQEASTPEPPPAAGSVDFGYDFMDDGETDEGDPPAPPPEHPAPGDGTAMPEEAGHAPEMTEPSPETDLFWDTEPPAEAPAPTSEAADAAEPLFDAEPAWTEESPGMPEAPPAAAGATPPTQEAEHSEFVPADDEPDSGNETAPEAEPPASKGPAQGAEQIDLSGLFGESDPSPETDATIAQVVEPGESPPEEDLAELLLGPLEETPGGEEPWSSEDLPALREDVLGVNPTAPLPGATAAEIMPKEPPAEATGVEEEATAPATEEAAEEREAVSAPPIAARLAAGLADLAILGLVFALFVVVGEITLAPTAGAGVLPTIESMLALSTPYFLVLFTLCFGYFTLFHFLTGQTPGKMFFRLRVEGEEGAALLFSQAFLRSAGGLLCLLPAGLGFLRIVFDGQGRGWNDRLAGSRVVCVPQKDEGAVVDGERPGEEEG